MQIYPKLMPFYANLNEKSVNLFLSIFLLYQKINKIQYNISIIII